MPALVAGIHALELRACRKAWMAGTSPAMTELESPHHRSCLRREREMRDRPDERVEPVGRAPVTKAVGTELRHLVFERGKGSDVAHAALLIECGDGLGAQPLVSSRTDGGDRDTCIDFGDHDARHLAALVHFDDDAVGLE